MKPISRLFVSSILVCAAFLGACTSTEYTGDPAENQPPTVWIAAAPPEGSIGSYTVSMYWGGWDPDGEISYYEFLITDNTTGVFNPADTVDVAWSPVYANDSSFVFSADSLSVPPTGQIVTFTRSHTFFIRAVDEFGMRSQEPAYRSFTSRTLSPEVFIVTPRRELGKTPANMPPISTLVWGAIDYVDDLDSKQDPDSVQWALINTRDHNNSYNAAILYLQDPTRSSHEWYPWVWYQAPQDSGTFWTTPPLDFGQYVFAVRAKDEAGAVTPVLTEPVNIRRIKVQPRNTGPTFVINSVLMGSVVASSCDYPLTIADVPSGVDITFSLSACADDYGGTVAGYRYGWDILDLNDPDQWEVDYTPFVSAFAYTPPRAFQFGTHTFTAEVIDNSGYCSRIEIKVNIIRFTGGRNLMIVDDYSPDEVTNQSGWDRTLGGMPNDGEHDGFWMDMVRELEGFDPLRDMISVTTMEDTELPLTTISNYKSIIWSVYGHMDTSNPSDLPMLYTYIQYRSKRPQGGQQGGACGAAGGQQGKVIPNYIGLAIQAGVHVMIAGHHPIQNNVQRSGGFRVTWPMIPLYELERANAQCGDPRPQDLANPPGDEGFAYRELCVDVLDFAYLIPTTARLQGGGACRRYCPTNGWRDPDGDLVNDTMRGAIAADPNFRDITLRAAAAGPGRAYAPEIKGISAEMYNPSYFRQGEACNYIAPPRGCFEPIYLMECLNTDLQTYHEPVGFWTSAFSDVVGEDIPNGVAARSVVFGFPPVYFEPEQFREGMEYILYDEWQLPRLAAASSSQ